MIIDDRATIILGYLETISSNASPVCDTGGWSVFPSKSNPWYQHIEFAVEVFPFVVTENKSDHRHFSIFVNDEVYLIRLNLTKIWINMVRDVGGESKLK